MKKTPLRQAAMKLALVACVLLAPLGLRAQETLTKHHHKHLCSFLGQLGRQQSPV